MSNPIEPGHVMSKEAYPRTLQRKPASEATEKRFDLNAAINIMVGATRPRIKAQQEAKCASNGTK